MTRKVFRYLKEKGITDAHLINSLFVTSFLIRNRWSFKHCNFLSSYILPNNHPALSRVLRYLDRTGNDYGLEELIVLFEFVISPADRIVTGAVYTPERVRLNILSVCLSEISDERLRDIRLADISCGCGSFLMNAAQVIHRRTGKPYSEIYRENIYGIDIESYAVERTKILLSLLAISEGEDSDFVFNLLHRDTLDYAMVGWEKEFDGFDIIVGNPPYVCSRNLSEEMHEKLSRYEVCSSGHPDLYLPFFQIATDMLNDGGRLGLITMNTFLRSVNGRALRSYLSGKRYGIRVLDFRGCQIFESKNTYTCLFFMDKHLGTDFIHYAADENGELRETVEYIAIPYSELDNEKGWALNDYEKTRQLESTGIQIQDYCPSRHGLATLSNETYIFSPVAEDRQFYYLKADGITFPVEKELCRDIVNPNKLNSVEDLESLIEKVIFPYCIVEGKAVVYDPLVMEQRYPHALAYLRRKRCKLSERDKGNTKKYPQWYAYGRTQSLLMPRYKLFFPKFANRSLRCVICDAPNLMLYNGMAFVSENERRLQILKCVIESELFWRYIQANGKPYASGYYSLSGVDIKHFGIPVFTIEEEDELLKMDSKGEREEWLRMRYGVQVHNENNSSTDALL